MSAEKSWSILHAEPDADNSGWHGDSASRVQLSIPNGVRWVALDAQLFIDQFAPGVFFCCQTPDGLHRFAVPMSLGGKILEVLAVPEDSQSCWLELLSGPGFFQIQSLQLRPLNLLQSRWRFMRRGLRLCLQGTAEMKQHAEVNLWRAITASEQCYRRIGQLKACTPPMPYAEWQQRFEQLTANQLRMIERRLPELLARHGLLLLLLQQSTTVAEDWQRSLLSIEQSLGLSAATAKLTCLLVSDEATLTPHCRLPTQLTTVAQAQQQLAELPDSQPVLLLPAGVALAPVALCWWLEAFDAAAASWCYSDHDFLDQHGKRTEPQFKPDWSQELARSSHYTGDTLLVQAKALLASGWLQPELAVTELKVQQLVLQLSALLPKPPLHLPAVLWHQPLAQRQLPSADILRQQLQQQGIAARVETNAHGLLDIHYPLPEPAPLVSVVIPTRDMLHLLKPCVDSLLHRTDYPAIEVLIVDNQSAEPATLAYFDELAQEPRVRVLRYDHPFNYSAINNFAVQQARGELICLLNNDTEVIRPDWLCQMVGQLTQPGVGIVGARLLFADQRVQHAGDAIGIGGCATHLHFRLPADAPGYMGRALVSQDLSAVTAACLLTPKDLYLELGGLNETDLTVAFNDVDYCLKAGEAGWRVLYTPLALLYHYESVSRGKDDNPVKKQRAAKEAAYMRTRWARQMQGDPFYNPNLNGTAADFRLSAAPRVRKPWPR
ncbi:glycosyltransferase family 2 protein [Alkalimonas delamerensis]|uniref:Glycosyltransferase family 2 protein n=1 Tax=Alkalimonas delamerensis TaxID=265981 RepID=A0ABT9GQB5_9GAMM|nr:glycosyltransferase family 2 protein [Alkalimonas delamerensis]MDP4528970.1 glycosyltransferase family 2 protein [Alkalimonas delamerensis]